MLKLIIIPVEKFNHLKSSLEGQPLSLIRNLKITNDNYNFAFEIIIKCYSNNRLQVKIGMQSIILLNFIILVIILMQLINKDIQ